MRDQDWNGHVPATETAEPVEAEAAPTANELALMLQLAELRGYVKAMSVVAGLAVDRLDAEEGKPT